MSSLDTQLTSPNSELISYIARAPEAYSGMWSVLRYLVGSYCFYRKGTIRENWICPTVVTLWLAIRQAPVSINR